MKHGFQPRASHFHGRGAGGLSGRLCLGFFAVLIAVCWAFRASAQLAITEAMTSTSTNLGSLLLEDLSDFWELTNFGDEDIPLTGYIWNDNSGGWMQGDYDLFNGLVISNHESIVFVETDPLLMSTNEQFREWWGIPDTVRIFFYFQNGLSSRGDGVRLWDPDATSDEDVVDSVDFGQARRGFSFTYDPATGVFGAVSVEGEGGAFKAVTRDDVGSPGTTTGPVPLQILQQPTNQTACLGSVVEISVSAGGLPRPRYQWWAHGSILPGATRPTLTITNFRASDAGSYFVEIQNGFETNRSDAVDLAVFTTPTAPTLQAPLRDRIVLENQSAVFWAKVCAYPEATYHWWVNGVLMDATNHTLRIPQCPLSDSGNTYCVEATNEYGRLELCARLTVNPVPDLEFTEVMSCPSPTCFDYGDWCEVSNVGSTVVDLLGFRFATGNGFLPTLKGAWTVPESALLRPGESAIFVRNMTRDRFLNWWGPEALPPGLVVINYAGQGLAHAGDELYLWGPNTDNDLDYLASASYAGEVNGLFCGTSQVIRKGGANTEDYSEAGLDGTFEAAECGDIGSPGYLSNPPPRFSSLVRDGNNLRLRWRAVVGHRYQLMSKENLEEPEWGLLGIYPATETVSEISLPGAGTDGRRFYRLEDLGP